MAKLAHQPSPTRRARGKTSTPSGPKPDGGRGESPPSRETTFTRNLLHLPTKDERSSPADHWLPEKPHAVLTPDRVPATSTGLRRHRRELQEGRRRRRAP